MKFYKFALLKSYFDKGYSVTNYLKTPLGFIGLKIFSVEWLILSFVFYAIGCFFLGMIWYKFHITDAEYEVGNKFNPLAYEIRGAIKKKKI